MRRRASGAARRDERGVVGFEVLPFLVIVFVVGTLVFAQAWAVLDAKLTTTSAAREATRTFVEQPSRPGSGAAVKNALEAGRRVLHSTQLTQRGTIKPVGAVSLRRCDRVTFEATVAVPNLAPARSANRAEIVVTSRHTEVVDPLRSGLTGRARCIK